MGTLSDDTFLDFPDTNTHTQVSTILVWEKPSRWHKDSYCYHSYDYVSYELPIYTLILFYTATRSIPFQLLYKHNFCYGQGGNPSYFLSTRQKVSVGLPRMKKKINFCAWELLKLCVFSTYPSFRSLISCSAKDKVPGSVLSAATHSIVCSSSSSSVTLVPESQRRYELFKLKAFSNA